MLAREADSTQLRFEVFNFFFDIDPNNVSNRFNGLVKKMNDYAQNKKCARRVRIIEKKGEGTNVTEKVNDNILESSNRQNDYKPRVQKELFLKSK